MLVSNEEELRDMEAVLVAPVGITLAALCCVAV